MMNRFRRKAIGGLLLTADSELGGNRDKLFVIFIAEILQKAFALADHGKKTFTGAVVLLVGTHVFGDFRDALREKSDLNFRRTGVAFLAGKLVDDLSSLCLVHRFNPFAVCVFGSRSVPDREAVTA